MKILIYVLLVLATSSGYAQVIPHFLPEGEVVVVGGEELIQFNFEDYRELLHLDQELLESRIVIPQLNAAIDELQMQAEEFHTQLELAENLISDLNNNYEIILGDLQRSQVENIELGTELNIEQKRRRNLTWSSGGTSLIAVILLYLYL